MTGLLMRLFFLTVPPIAFGIWLGRDFGLSVGVISGYSLGLITSIYYSTSDMQEQLQNRLESQNPRK